jgi:hypothetical protein
MVRHLIQRKCFSRRRKLLGFRGSVKQESNAVLQRSTLCMHLTKRVPSNYSHVMLLETFAKINRCEFNKGDKHCNIRAHCTRISITVFSNMTPYDLVRKHQTVGWTCGFNFAGHNMGLSWRIKQQVTTKRWQLSTKQHGLTFQKAPNLIINLLIWHLL